MNIDFKVISVSFKNSSLEIRGLMALDDNSIRLLLDKIRSCSSIKEVMVLSTCNRTEIYYVSKKDESQLLIRLTGLVKGMDLSKYSDHFRVINDSKKATEYLFRVAAGLESQVLGDLQIPYQVKKAYQISVTNNFAGPLIHRLLHTVFYTNKRIMQETSFRDGAASISYTASKLVKRLVKNIARPNILIIGLGGIGQDVCKNLSGNDKLDIYISNRTKARAYEMAASHNFSIISFDKVFDAIYDMDVVISTIGADQPLITKNSLKNNIAKPQTFIDLSVPRSVAFNISEIPGTNLINLDELQSKVDSVLLARQNAIPLVEAKIKESMITLSEWSKEVLVAPTIGKIKGALEQIRKEELARFLKKGNPEDYKIAQEATKTMVQKIIKLPVLHLKAACRRGEAESLMETLNELFDLEQISNHDLQ